MTRWRTADGKWTVEVVRFADTTPPRRADDPQHGPGEYLLARSGPYIRVYARDVTELVTKTGLSLTELKEVTP